MRQRPTYFLSVRWLPPAGRIPSFRRASENDIDSATATRAAASLYRGPERGICERMFVQATDGTVTGEPGFEPDPAGPKPAGRANYPTPQGHQRRYHQRTSSTVLVLVRHATRFAALFLGRASWRDYAEHSHCLEAE